MMYIVQLQATCTVYIDVEAQSPEVAEEMAIRAYSEDRHAWLQNADEVLEAVAATVALDADSVKQ